MRTYLEKFIINPDLSLMQALKKINANKEGFLICVKNSKVVGVITDGDIRRALIAGNSLDGFVKDTMNTKISTLKDTEALSLAIDLFKNEAIKFLPIVNAQNELTNVLTKNQLYSVLLQDVHADTHFDFASLDENIVDHEIFQRPWGFYRTTVMNEYFQSKVISVKPNAQLSLQSHNHREEHWIVAHGNGVVQIGESVLQAKCGDRFFIPKGCKHRLSNTSDKDSLIVIEIQLGDYFGEDDIIRYEDVYGRNSFKGTTV